MRKSQVLLVGVALLLCSTVAVQAQGAYQAFSNPLMARTGGAREVAGELVLFLTQGAHSLTGNITVKFSAPLAEDVAVEAGGIVVTLATAVINTAENTISLTPTDVASADPIELSGVRLDVRGAVVPVTATISGNSEAFISGAVNVISDSVDALEIDATGMSLLSRGGTGNATVTVEETFARALTEAGSMVMLRVSGVPDAADLTITAAGVDAAAAGVAGNVTVAVGALTPVTVVTGGLVTAAGQLMTAGTGGDIDVMVAFSAPDGSSTESVTLNLNLDTDDPVSPIFVAQDTMVSAMATMAPTSAPATIVAGTEYFSENFTDAAELFTFAPASCTLLFPYVVSLPELEMAWNTGIAITNPTAMGTPQDGAITFTLFTNGSDTPMEYTTDAMTPGTTLDAEGMLAAGNTYTVLLSELAAWAGHEGDITGHLYVKTNFTGCRGVGWVTDFGTVNQAYLAYFRADDADLDTIPAN